MEVELLIEIQGYSMPKKTERAPIKLLNPVTDQSAYIWKTTGVKQSDGLTSSCPLDADLDSSCPA
jgi:hypothetical protein